ncbi:hypothetical protein CEE37_07870 [candidate division LCP-89 bacterium B3_LCP]|uniref:PhoU domain-containing protein n=1 Tax=candidate division LCP-89 bacterium B3_LCP TaxID=2012998 RepID=A0A532UZ47_UNCL8|nr:MAG: hypothetical protein CEE37_07870 [candidate division LCP-89 bacterium B3_LCP]
MFKALIEMFRKEDLLQQAFHDSHKMLKTCKQMFDAALISLRKSDNGEMKMDVFAMDEEINQYQRTVRGKVLAYLAVTASKDPVFSLVLVSVVIDIERIGDYTKNIIELAQEHPKKLHAGPLESTIVQVENNISERFERLVEAFEKSDDDIARTVMQLHRVITQTCDGILITLIRDEHPEYVTTDAVTIALYSRYLKRISSHITNIASGMVNPFDRIGFREKNNGEID